MITAAEVKELVMGKGADLCGIAPVSRFSEAPQGFSPLDIYSGAKSVIVFLKRVPSGSLFAESCVPYTHVNTMMMRLVDSLTLEISIGLEELGVKTVLIPTDDPYEWWNASSSTGKAILSLRHAAVLAGLGRLGRNGLLLNDRFGSMVQIGALLTDAVLSGDSPASYEVCPPGCSLCLDSCPVGALDGTSVTQALCRPLSVFVHEKGYVLKKCYMCRKVCPHSTGVM